MFGPSSCFQKHPILTSLVNFSRRKIDTPNFLGGFYPLDINASGVFFSQISLQVQESVCSDFEENRRGRPIGVKFSFPHRFFPKGNFGIFYVANMFGPSSCFQKHTVLPSLVNFSWRKIDTPNFLGRFYPLDSNASGGFFSQINLQVQGSVRSDFEEYRGGCPHRGNIFVPPFHFRSIFEFSLREIPEHFITQIYLGHRVVSKNTQFYPVWSIFLGEKSIPQIS